MASLPAALIIALFAGVQHLLGSDVQLIPSSVSTNADSLSRNAGFLARQTFLKEVAQSVANAKEQKSTEVVDRMMTQVFLENGWQASEKVSKFDRDQYECLWMMTTLVPQDKTLEPEKGFATVGFYVGCMTVRGWERKSVVGLRGLKPE